MLNDLYIHLVIYLPTYCCMYLLGYLFIGLCQKTEAPGTEKRRREKKSVYILIEFSSWMYKHIRGDSWRSTLATYRSIKVARQCMLTISIHLQINCFFGDWISDVRFW